MDIYKVFINPKTGEKLVICYDMWAKNPRTAQGYNVGEFIVGDRCRYIDNESSIQLDLACRDDDIAVLDKSPDVIAYLPVYVYDHSGARMNTTGFSCPWDSGQVGWIVCTRESLRRIGFAGWKRITKKRRETVLEWLRREVETYSAYMSGETYGFRVFEANPDGEDDDNGIDSCWGYYGDDGIQAIRDEYPEFTEEIA